MVLVGMGAHFHRRIQGGTDGEHNAKRRRHTANNRGYIRKLVFNKITYMVTKESCAPFVTLVPTRSTAINNNIGSYIYIKGNIGNYQIIKLTNHYQKTYFL